MNSDRQTMTSPWRWWRTWWNDLDRLEQAVAIAVFVAVTVLLLVLPAFAETATPIQLFVPIDVVALVQAIFSGAAAIAGAFAAVYSVVAAQRAKRAELATVENAIGIAKVHDTVALVERNTDSLTTQLQASSRLAGLKEGEARGQLAGEATARTLLEGQRQGGEKARADASEVLADATKRVAAAAETKKE
jgi:hypothetical protein